MSKATIPPEIAERIDGYVDKYTGILQIAGAPPSIKIRNDPKAPWLGRLAWRSERPHTSILELQKRLFKNDRHLERVIAHEMIHHRDFLKLPKGEVERIDAGLVPDAPKKHTASFAKGAARINKVMGAGFVKKEEASEDLPKYLLPTESSFSTKLLLGLGIGGLALLGAALLGKRQPESSNTAQPARENERGSYGK